MATGPGGADVASEPTWRCGSTAPLRRGAEATWQDACGPRAGGAPSGREATWAPVWGATCRGVERICYDS